MTIRKSKKTAKRPARKGARTPAGKRPEPPGGAPKGGVKLPDLRSVVLP